MTVTVMMLHRMHVAGDAGAGLADSDASDDWVRFAGLGAHHKYRSRGST